MLINILPTSQFLSVSFSYSKIFKIWLLVFFSLPDSFIVKAYFCCKEEKAII